MSGPLRFPHKERRSPTPKERQCSNPALVLFDSINWPLTGLTDRIFGFIASSASHSGCTKPIHAGHKTLLRIPRHLVMRLCQETTVSDYPRDLVNVSPSAYAHSIGSSILYAQLETMSQSLPSVFQSLAQTSQADQGVLLLQHGVGSFPGTEHSQVSDHGVDKANSRSGKRPAARGTAFYPRKRANTACQVCRARKTKCDGGVPSCSYCTSVGATCIRSTSDLSSFDPASIKILERLNDLETMLKSLSAASGVSADRGSTGLAESSVAPYADPEPLCAWFHMNEDPVTSSNSGMGTCHVLPQCVDHIISWPMFRAGRQGSGIEEASPGALADSRPLSTSAASLLSALELDSVRIHQLLDNFFTSIHVTNPILDELSTRHTVKKTIMDGIGWSSASCLTLIICALGCLANPLGLGGIARRRTEDLADAKALFEASQKRIGSLLVQNDLITAQCLFLSGVYMMHLFQPGHGWRFFLQALAVCQYLPSIREARRLGSTPATPPSPSELASRYTQEQAVYWSAWKSERELRAELPLPDFEIHETGSALYPPFFPMPPIPKENIADTDEAKAEALRARDAWLFYLADISLRRLTSRVCSAMASLEKEAPSNTEFLTALLEMIPDYEFQARQWRDSLPEELSLAGSSEDDGVSQFILRGKMTNFFEIVYWPFVLENISRLFASMPVVPAFEDMAARGLDIQLMQIRVNELGFAYRHHGCFFMIRSCTRSALVLLAAARVGATMPADWDTSVREVTRMQLYWEEEDVEVRKWRCLIESELASIGR